MFGDKNLQTQPGSAVPMGTPPQENGIVSTVKELMEAIQDNASTTQTLEDALGISQAALETAAQSQGPSSLLQVLRSAIYRVRSANERLYQVIRHINS